MNATVLIHAVQWTRLHSGFVVDMFSEVSPGVSQHHVIQNNYKTKRCKSLRKYRGIHH